MVSSILSKMNNSISKKLFVCTQLYGSTYSYSILIIFKYVDLTYGTTTSGHSGPVNKTNKVVLYTSQGSRIVDSPPDAV